MTTAHLLSAPPALLALLAGTAGTAGAAGAAHDLDGSETAALLARAGVGVVAALVVAVVVGVLVRRVGRRSAVVRDLSRRGRAPLRALLVVLVLHQVAVRAPGTDDWLDVSEFVLTLALIATAAWLVAVLAFVAEDVVVQRYRVDVADNRHARRVRTQVTFLRRVTVVVVAVLAVAVMLTTIPGARNLGAGILASAGLLSVVAGLALQQSLGNLFAGLQLAFTDALRVDDVVVVEEEWGRIEEITLTYVVVHVWDDRRLVLPSTYFTSTPFQHWTRKESQLIGVVLLDVDWATDLDAMREELRRVLEADPLWDRRVSVLQVTDAVGGSVQVRILVSAQDGPTVFDLRCHVREAMVRWVQQQDPAGLPRLRVESERPAQDGARAPRPLPSGSGAVPSRERAGGHPSRAPRVDTPATAVLPAVSPAVPERRDDSLFTGSLAAVERSRYFTGPPPEEQAERARADGDEPDGRTRPLPRADDGPHPRGRP
ncbi:mechanosensitive ion channel family protein [Quadrisphaera sp. DSM 44207]|uniref:mechanosensitive ion channel family protein n=1 Tax=Quadrisphaera sp. DSM 44207 TaxID=1881057 RepID=UPI000888567B|nr:mechanosensitive ion channel domain-containing protein [Quadrisphaera sp. DSM 44207]SDQ45673.1 Small-conductance mechanosensitive channel [Quadrisphaera sp. DSM 44207]